MEVELAFLCDAATIDRDGKMNILGIFDTLGGEKFPLNIYRIMLVISFVGKSDEEGDHSLEVKLLSPDGGDMITPMKMKFDIPPGGGKARIISEMNNIVFKQTGPYSFEILVDEKSLESITVQLVQGPPPSTAQPSKKKDVK